MAKRITTQLPPGADPDQAVADSLASSNGSLSMRVLELMQQLRVVASLYRTQLRSDRRRRRRLSA
jgi:hypothetical protein